MAKRTDRAKAGAADGEKPNVGGRPAHVVTDEEIAEARALLGRFAYRSTVAQRLQEKFSIGRDTAYKVIDCAVKETRDEISAAGKVDPVALAYSGLVSVATADIATNRDRVAAWIGVIKLLGLSKLIDGLRSEDDVKNFMADVQARAMARVALGAGLVPTPAEANP